MKIPQLAKKPEKKSCHNTIWEDNYSWIHQKNILEVLKDSTKLVPEVRKYSKTKYSRVCKGFVRFKKNIFESDIFLKKTVS